MFKFLPVRGCTMGAKDLFCKLMGHFVQKDFSHSIPGMVNNEISTQADLVFFPGPVSPPAIHVTDAEQRPLHFIPVWGVKCPNRILPFARQTVENAPTGSKVPGSTYGCLVLNYLADTGQGRFVPSCGMANVFIEPF